MTDRKPTWKSKLLILPPLALAIGVLVWVVANKRQPAQKPVAEQTRHVRVITARALDLVPRVTGFGTVSPAKVWSAIAQVSGQVVYVHPKLKRGAVLPGGTEIIRIDDRDYKLAIAEAQANIRSAEAKLAELEVTEQNHKALLEIERRSLKLKETQLKRTVGLVKQGTIAKATEDDERRATLAQRKLVQDLENKIALLPTQVRVQNEQIAVYKARLATQELNLKRTRIKLPFSARVAEVSVELTQFAQTGAKLVVADGIEIAEIEAQFPLSQMAVFASGFETAGLTQSFRRLNVEQMAEKAGLHALIRLKSTNRTITWRGRIVRVSDVIDPKTRTVGIIAAVKGSYRMAKPGKRPPLTKGLFLEVELRANPRKARVMVPRAALHGGNLYLANAENRLEIRAVKPNLTIGDLADVTGTVKPGEKVVVSDLDAPITGMALNITDDKALAAAIAKSAAGSPPS
jgi:hypothetical protein